MPKLQKSQNRYSITLNAKIINLLGWKKGDNIELESDLKGRLYLIKRVKPNIKIDIPKVDIKNKKWVKSF